ncbi:MAG: CbtB-domain containing protein [Thermoleophilaceae bacterium]|nr:CbtB-domain containing protein [Thermoleophilaceae bacterium]
MSEVAAGSAARPEVVNPPAISAGELWPWALFGVALMLLIYFVGIDEGAASVVPGSTLHEWVHDGRHLLGFPCH